MHVGGGSNEFKGVRRLLNDDGLHQPHSFESCVSTESNLHAWPTIDSEFKE